MNKSDLITFIANRANASSNSLYSESSKPSDVLKIIERNNLVSNVQMKKITKCILSGLTKPQLQMIIYEAGLENWDLQNYREQMNSKVHQRKQRQKSVNAKRRVAKQALSNGLTSNITDIILTKAGLPKRVQRSPLSLV